MDKAIAHTSHRIKSIGAVLSLLVGVWAYPTAMAAEQPPSDGFHWPKTSAELALDGLLLLAEADVDLGWYATGRNTRDAKKDGRFARYFSKKLVTEWRKAEIAELKRNCGGRYVEGDMCGLETHPITCSQSDYPDGYYYRTEQAGQGWAVISYRWPPNSSPLATYRMVKSGHRWIMDGVACRGDLKFNMD